MYSADERAYLWLCAATKTDYHERVALLRSAPSPVALFEEPARYFSEIGKASAFSPERERREEEAERFLSSLEGRGRFAVTLLSEDYPESLKHISVPPLVLFGAGRRELLKKRRFCIVGSRIIPPWAARLGRTMSEELSEKFAIVTGLAEGGDLSAVEGALPSGNLICVLPCGLNCCYPAAHGVWKERVEKAGLVLTELLPDETAKKYSFHARNRLLAGLSEGVLVLAAGRRSGTLITANDALDFGRDVFALPHNVGAAHGEGCNELIKKGAYLATSSEDILSVYGMERTARAAAELSPEEKKLLEVLREYGEAHAAVIAERVGMSAFEAMAILSALELKGYAVRAGGNQYSAI